MGGRKRGREQGTLGIRERARVVSPTTHVQGPSVSLPDRRVAGDSYVAGDRHVGREEDHDGAPIVRGVLHDPDWPCAPDDRDCEALLHVYCAGAQKRRVVLDHNAVRQLQAAPVERLPLAVGAAGDRPVADHHRDCAAAAAERGIATEQGASGGQEGAWALSADRTAMYTRRVEAQGAIIQRKVSAVPDSAAMRRAALGNVDSLKANCCILGGDADRTPVLGGPTSYQ